MSSFIFRPAAILNLLFSLKAWQHPKKLKIAKIISLLICMCFIFPYMAFAFQTATYPVDPINLTGRTPIKINGQPIEIAPEKGHVVSTFQGASSKIVIYIQDLHCNYEVQANIAAMLQSLSEKHQLRLVGVEGDSEQIDVSLLSSYPIKKIKLDAGKYFLKRGMITGAEFLSATGEKPLRLEGIEQQALYDQNEKTMLQFLNEETHGYCEDLRYVLERLKKPVYNLELAKLDHQREQYDYENISLESYCTFLFTQAQQQGLNLEDYPAMQLFAAEKRLPIHATLGYEKLLREAEALNLALRQPLYTSADQRRLDQYLYTLRVMEAMLNISATEEDLLYFRSHRQEFSAAAVLNFLEDICYRYAIQPDLDPQIMDLDKALALAAEFYVVADQRSTAFVSNLLKQMQVQKVNLAAMITGGFHASQVEAALQANKISYVAVKPRITNTDEANPYFSLVRNQPTPLEKLLARKEELFGLKSRLKAGSNPNFVRHFGAVKAFVLELYLINEEGLTDPRLRLARAQQIDQDWLAALKDHPQLNSYMEMLGKLQLQDTEDLSNPAQKIYGFQFPGMENVYLFLRPADKATNLRHLLLLDEVPLENGFVLQVVHKDVLASAANRNQILGTVTPTQASPWALNRVFLQSLGLNQPITLFVTLLTLAFSSRENLRLFLAGLLRPLQANWIRFTRAAAKVWRDLPLKIARLNPWVVAGALVVVTLGGIIASAAFSALTFSATLPLLLIVGGVFLVLMLYNHRTPWPVKVIAGTMVFVVAAALLFNSGNTWMQEPRVAELPTFNAAGTQMSFVGGVIGGNLFALKNLWTAVKILYRLRAARLKGVMDYFYLLQDALRLLRAQKWAETQYGYDTLRMAGDEHFLSDLAVVLEKEDPTVTGGEFWHPAMKTFLKTPGRLALAGIAYHNGRLPLVEDEPEERLKKLLDDYTYAEGLANAILQGKRPGEISRILLTRGNSFLKQLVQYLAEPEREPVFQLGAQEADAPERLLPEFFTETQIKAIRKLVQDYNVTLGLTGLSFNPALGFNASEKQIEKVYNQQIELALRLGADYIAISLTPQCYNPNLVQRIINFAKAKELEIGDLVTVRQTAGAQAVPKNMVGQKVSFETPDGRFSFTVPPDATFKRNNQIQVRVQVGASVRTVTQPVQEIFGLYLWSILKTKYPELTPPTARDCKNLMQGSYRGIKKFIFQYVIPQFPDQPVTLEDALKVIAENWEDTFGQSFQLSDLVRPPDTQEILISGRPLKVTWGGRIKKADRKKIQAALESPEVLRQSLLRIFGYQLPARLSSDDYATISYLDEGAEKKAFLINVRTSAGSYAFVFKLLDKFKVVWGIQSIKQHVELTEKAPELALILGVPGEDWWTEEYFDGEKIVGWQDIIDHPETAPAGSQQRFTEAVKAVVKEYMKLAQKGGTLFDPTLRNYLVKHVGLPADHPHWIAKLVDSSTVNFTEKLTPERHVYRLFEAFKKGWTDRQERVPYALILQGVMEALGPQAGQSFLIEALKNLRQAEQDQGGQLFPRQQKEITAIQDFLSAREKPIFAPGPEFRLGTNLAKKMFDSNEARWNLAKGEFAPLALKDLSLLAQLTPEQEVDVDITYDISFRPGPVQETKRLTVSKMINLIKDRKIQKLHIVKILTAAAPNLATIQGKLADPAALTLLQQISPEDVLEGTITFASGQSVRFIGNLAMLQKALEQPEAQAFVYGEPARWLPSLHEVSPEQRVAGYDAVAAMLGQLGPQVRYQATGADLTRNQPLHHGTVRGYIPSLAQGPKNVGKGFGGRGLYLAFETEVADQFAYLATQEYQARKEFYPETPLDTSQPGFNQAVILQGKLNPDKQFQVGRFRVVRDGIVDLQRGILPADWDRDPMLVAFMERYFDVLEILDTQKSGLALHTNRFLVVHESAGADAIAWEPSPLASRDFGVAKGAEATYAEVAPQAQPVPQQRQAEIKSHVQKLHTFAGRLEKLLKPFVADAAQRQAIRRAFEALQVNVRLVDAIRGAIGVHQLEKGQLDVVIESGLNQVLAGSTILHEAIEAILKAQGIENYHALAYIIEQALVPQSIFAKLNYQLHYDLDHLRTIVANTADILHQQNNLALALQRQQKQNALLVALTAIELLPLAEKARALAAVQTLAAELNATGRAGRQIRQLIKRIQTGIEREDAKLTAAENALNQLGVLMHAAVDNNSEQNILQRGFENRMALGDPTGIAGVFLGQNVPRLEGLNWRLNQAWFGAAYSASNRIFQNQASERGRIYLVNQQVSQRARESDRANLEIQTEIKIEGEKGQIGISTADITGVMANVLDRQREIGRMAAAGHYCDLYLIDRTPTGEVKLVEVITKAELESAAQASPEVELALEQLRHEQVLGIKAQPEVAGGLLSRLAFNFRHSRLGQNINNIFGLPFSLRLMLLLPSGLKPGVARVLLVGFIAAAWLGIGVLMVAGWLSGDMALQAVVATLAILAPPSYIQVRMKADPRITSEFVRQAINNPQLAQALNALQKNWGHVQAAGLVRELIRALDQAKDQNDMEAVEQLLDVLSDFPGKKETLQLNIGGRQLIRQIPAIVIEKPSLLKRLDMVFPLLDRKGKELLPLRKRLTLDVAA